MVESVQGFSKILWELILLQKQSSGMLSSAGLPVARFYFEGFYSTKNKYQDRQLLWQLMLFLDCDNNVTVTHSNTKIQKWHEINKEKPEICLYHLKYTLVLS